MEAGAAPEAAAGEPSSARAAATPASRLRRGCALGNSSSGLRLCGVRLVPAGGRPQGEDALWQGCLCPSGSRHPGVPHWRAGASESMRLFFEMRPSPLQPLLGPAPALGGVAGCCAGVSSGASSSSPVMSISILPLELPPSWRLLLLASPLDDAVGCCAAVLCASCAGGCGAGARGSCAGGCCGDDGDSSDGACGCGCGAVSGSGSGGAAAGGCCGAGAGGWAAAGG